MPFQEEVTEADAAFPPGGQKQIVLIATTFRYIKD